jgi:hypothetical protein
MLDDWDERDEVVAAGSICPIPDCGALVISYRPQTAWDTSMPNRGVSSRVRGAESTSPPLKMN